MKRVFAFLLVFCLMLGAVPLVYAEDGGGKKVPITVISFEELQDALDKANDGDTIELQNPITIPESIIIGSADKHITIQLKNQNNNFYQPIFSIIGSDKKIELRNITFDCQNIQIYGILTVFKSEVVIDECIFKNIHTDMDYVLNFANYADMPESTVMISNSTFDNIYGQDSLIKVFGNYNMVISGCTFSDIKLTYRTLMYNSGTTFLIENNFQENTANEYYVTVDNRGTLYLDTDMSHYAKYYGYEPQGWYKIIERDWMIDDGGDPFTIEKIETDSINELCRLAFFTEKAAGDFVTEQPQDNKDDPDNPGEEDSKETQPQEPGDQTGENDATGGEQPPQEPTQQPEGKGADDPADNSDNKDNDDPQEPAQPPEGNVGDNPTDNPEQPTEPLQGDSNTDNENDSDENPEQTQPEGGEGGDNPTDDPSDSTDNTPDAPQESSDSDNGEDSNYPPSTDYRPSQRPSRPSTSDKTPAETDQSQEKPDNDTTAPEAPQLACNGAVIDTSRTIVLFGYGDGLLHEDDPLTRAQLATIIYRLLADKSIAKYSNAQLAFTDVPADAWYTPYVRAIEAAGIVSGVGNGKYDPDGTVTWAHIVTILTRFVEAQEYTLQNIQYSGWATQAIKTAVALDWIEDRADFDPDAVIGRGELVQFVNKVLALYR